MSRMFTDADLDAVLGPADSAQTFTDADLDAALGGGLSVATQSPGIAAPMTPHDYGESWSPDQPQVQPRLDAGSMMNPMNYVAGVPDAAKGLARGFGQTVGGVAQAAPEAAAWLGEGVGGTLYVTKKKIAGFLRSIGQERDAALMDHLADLDYQNTQGAVGAVRKAGQGMSRWGQEVALGARMDPSLQYSPQAQQGVDSMQQGKTWLPTTAQGLMAMGGESGVPTLAALGGGAVAGPAGAMAAGGVAALGTTYDQSLQQMLNDPRWATRPVQEVKAEAARRAIQSGIVEGGTGAIPVEEALAGPLSKRFLTPGAGRVASGAVRGAAGMGEEALQGGAAEALGAVGDRAQGDPNAFQNLPQRVLQQAVAEGVMGLGPGAVGGFVSPGGVHAVRDAQRSTPTPDAPGGQGPAVTEDAVAPTDAVRPVASDVPGGGDVQQEAAAGGVVDPFTNPAATDAEILAALAELEGMNAPRTVSLPVLREPRTVALDVLNAPSDYNTGGSLDIAGMIPRDAAADAPDALAANMRFLSQQAEATGLDPSRYMAPDTQEGGTDGTQEEVRQEVLNTPGAADAAPEVSEPTTLEEWQAEARRMGVSDKGTVGLIRKRVREARASLAESTTQLPGAPTDSGPSGLPAQPAASSESLPSVQEVGRSSSPTVSEHPAGREVTFDQFRQERGVEKFYIDHSELSPNGRVSGRQRRAAQSRNDARLAAFNAAEREYQAAVDSGEVVDPSGKFTPTDTITPRIAQIDASIRMWERVGVSQATGKMRPKYQRAIEAARAERAALAAKVTAPTTPAATESAAAAQPPRKKGGRKAAGTASTDTPRPASPGVEKGSTSVISPVSTTTKARRAAVKNGPSTQPQSSVAGPSSSNVPDTASEPSTIRTPGTPSESAPPQTPPEQRPQALSGEQSRQASPKGSNPRRRGAVAFPAGDDATKRADRIATMERRNAKKAAAALESEQSAHDKTRARKEDFRERAKGDIALLKGLIRAEASRVKGMTEARDRALNALAREAVRADHTETNLREKIGSLQEDAAFKDALSKERSKAQTILLRAMADILPRSEWGTYTRRVADVKTASQAYKLAEDMQRQAVILDAKDLAKRVERVTGIKDIRDLADPKARQRAVDRGRLRILSGNEGEKDLARKALYDFAEMGAKFDELMDKAGSAQEMQDVVNALEATYQQLAGAMHQRRMENKLVGKNGMQAAQGSRDILESAIRGRAALPTDKTTKPETSAFGVLARSQLDAENTLLLMDDDAMTKAGEASRHFEEIRQARSAAAKRAEGRMLELDAIAKDAGFDGWGDARARISGSLGEASQMTVTLGKPIGGRSELTMDEALYLYGLDPQTQERAIIKGRPLSWDGNRTKKWELGWQEYDALRRAIPEQYRTMFDRMKLVTEKNKPEMMETLRLINGFEPPSVAGYLRTWANPEFYKKADETPAGYNADTVTYLEHMGLTKEREPSAGVPLLMKGGLDAIESSITDSSRIIELAIPLRNARAVLLSQQVRAATAEHIGEDVNKSVEQLLVAAAGNRKAPDGMADRLMRKAVSNVARGKTQVNPRSWLKNTGGVLKALGEAPPSVVLEGLAKLPRSILKNPGEFSSAATQEMMDHSPYLSERYTGSPVTVLTGIQQTGVKYGKWSTVQAAGRSISAGHVGDVLFKQVPALLDHIRLSLWFDAVTASTLWRGYKAKAEREGLGMEWVASQTERVMRRTQNSADPLDVSSFALDHRDRAAWAAVLSFTSDSNRSYNMLYRARRQGWKSMLRAGAAVAANQAWSSAVTGGLSAAGIAWLIGAIKGDDEEKQYERRQKALDAAVRSFLTETAGMTIFGDDTADMVWGALNPDSQTGGAVTPVGGTIDMLRSGIQRTARASMQLRNPVDRRAKEEAYDRMMNAALDVAKSGSSLLGLPFEPGIGMGEAVYGATHDKPADVIREQKEKTKGKPASDRDITDARRRLYDGMATGDEAQITGAFSALKANGVRLSRDDIEGLVKARDPYAGLKARERRELRQRLDKDPAAKAEFDRRVTEYQAAAKAVQNALRAQRRG